MRGKARLKGWPMKPLLTREQLVDRTLELWGPRFGRDLGREDARQIVENLIGFFAVLAEWSRAELPLAASDPETSTASDGDER
jgi:hypothetical protein